MRCAAANDDSIDPEIRQAFPKYSSNQAKEVLKNFPKEGAENRETGIKAQLSHRQRGKLFSSDAINKSKDNGFTYEQHIEAVANIQYLYENAVLLSKTNDLKNNDSNVKIYRFASPFVIDNKIVDALLTVKESIDKDSKKIYTMELTEIIQSEVRSDSGSQSEINYTHIEYLSDAVNKLQQKHEKVKQFLEKNQENFRNSLIPQVDTPAFKNWFGDSKIVDENGNPLVVYHGTNADFNIFDTEKFGAWFSQSIEYAESMMEERGGSRIVECYLAIQNPMTVKISPQQFAADTNLEKQLIAEAKAKGHEDLL